MHKISPLNYLEIRVAMMFVDQTDKTCKSNVVPDLGGVQFLSIVTNQPKFFVNGRAVKYQRVKESA